MSSWCSPNNVEQDSLQQSRSLWPRNTVLKRIHHRPQGHTTERLAEELKQEPWMLEPSHRRWLQRWASGLTLESPGETLPGADRGALALLTGPGVLGKR